MVPAQPIKNLRFLIYKALSKRKLYFLDLQTKCCMAILKISWKKTPRLNELACTPERKNINIFSITAVDAQSYTEQDGEQDER